MHLGNSVICPITGIPMLIGMAGVAFWSIKKLKNDIKNSLSKDKILLTVSLAIFVFSLQMINFSIPQLNSSGHFIGALLLSIILGPYLGFLIISSILLVQAIFFADGGLMALGCNIFNMGFLASFVVLPFIYKPLQNLKNPILGVFAPVISAIAVLQLGSFAVVVESFLSDSITNTLGFASFMQTIHFYIGIVEGILTAVILFLVKKVEIKKLSLIFCGISLLFSGVISNYASTKPDGLEWSLINMSENFVAQTQGNLYNLAAILQSKTALLSNSGSFENILGVFVVSLLSLFICFMINKTSTIKN